MTRIFLASIAGWALLFSSNSFAGDLLTLRVIEAKRGITADGSPTLDVRLSENSGHQFGFWTSHHVHETVNVLVDGRVVTRPRLFEPLTGGVFQIIGPSATEIDDLILKLVDGRSSMAVESSE